MALYTATPPEGAENKIWGHLAPYPGTRYPTHDPIHMKGGYRTLATTTAILNIPTSHRKHGMKAYCRSNKVTYRLNSNLTSWSVVNPVTATSVTSLALPYTEYIKSETGFERIVCHKYHDGRLEYYIRTTEAIIRSGSEGMYYAYRDYFKFRNTVHFIRTPNMTCTSINTRSANGLEISWAAGVLQNYEQFRIEPMTRRYENHAKQVIHVIGHWK